MEYDIRPINENDRPWVRELILKGGADFIITRGRTVYPHKLEAFVAVNGNNERVGLATYKRFERLLSTKDVHASG